MAKGSSKLNAQVLATIASTLKDTLEQKNVVGPLVAFLVQQGWELDQIVFGKAELS